MAECILYYSLPIDSQFRIMNFGWYSVDENSNLSGMEYKLDLCEHISVIKCHLRFILSMLLLRVFSDDFLTKKYSLLSNAINDITNNRRGYVFNEIEELRDHFINNKELFSAIKDLFAEQSTTEKLKADLENAYIIYRIAFLASQAALKA